MKILTLSLPLSLALCAGAWAQSVSFSLASPQNGQNITPGTTVNWTIAFTVSSGDNQGAALICADFVQDAANPVKFDIPPATAPVPAGMTNFARPAGITNPGDGGMPLNGYYGVQRGTAGQKNLIQIGGMQNTFGIAQNAGAGLAESATVVANVGQSGSQTLASGSFTAPSTAGTYSYSLANGLANLLVVRNSPPTVSPVIPAGVDTVGAQFSFTVSPCLRGDANCDGAVNNFDIDFFVLGILNTANPSAPAAYLAGGATQNCWDVRSCWGDANGDSAFNNFDIDGFVSCILSPPTPGQPCP